MEIVEFLIDIEVYKGLKLKKNKSYVMAGAVLNQLMKLYPGGVSDTGDFNSFYKKFHLKNIKENDEVFLFRSGGIGDVMFMLPLIKVLKTKFKARIKVATSPMYCSVLENNPYIDKIIQMPFGVEELEKSDHHIMFEGVIEDSSKKAQLFHAVDLFLEEAEINFKEVSSEEKVPHIFVTKEEKERIHKEMSRMRIDHNSIKVGIQLESSSPIRTFPTDKMIVIIKKLLERNYSVFAFGGRNQEELGKYISEVLIGEKNFINLIYPGRALRDAIVYTSFMDLCIAPDSAFIHISGGLGVPIIGLYGCFPSLLRMRYYKNAIGIDCGVICAPSFQHGHAACIRGFPSPCFSVIGTEDVINAVDFLLGKKDIRFIYPTYNEFKDGELIDSPFSVLKAGR